MSRQEVNDTINFQFNIQPELKNQIFSNIDEWYNGYYEDDTSPMYQTFSTQQYLNRCRHQYDSSKNHPKETNYTSWIPQPEQEWASSTPINILNNYMNFGFQGDFNVILKNLTDGRSVEFISKDKKFAPLLMDPTKPNMREKIIFHLLLHGGFLTKDGSRSNHYRIPNKELTDLFHSQLDEYLSKYPISDETVSILSKALLDENFTEFGAEVLKWLYQFYNADDDTIDEKKFRADGSGNILPQKYPLESHMHRLLWKIFKAINKEGYFRVMHEWGADPEDEVKEEGYDLDFIFSPRLDKTKPHIVLELKTTSPKRRTLWHSSLYGLKQIFEKNYHRDLLPFGSTQGITSVGITANTTELSLAALKINVNQGRYDSAENLTYQEFNITESTNGTLSFIQSNITEAEIDMLHYPNRTTRMNTGKISHNICQRLEDLIHNSTELKVKVAQPKSNASSTNKKAKNNTKQRKKKS
jgi:hypothetical protein